MGVWWQLAIGSVALWLIIRFVLSLLSPREPSESVDDPLVEDPLAGVPSPKRRGPQTRSGGGIGRARRRGREPQLSASQFVNRLFSVTPCLRSGFCLIW